MSAAAAAVINTSKPIPWLVFCLSVMICAENGPMLGSRGHTNAAHAMCAVVA